MSDERKNDDSFLDTVLAMADKMKLEGDDKQRYVHEHMTRSGYKMVPSYVLDGEEESGEGSDFFGNKKRKSGQSGNQGSSGGRGWF